MFHFHKWAKWKTAGGTKNYRDGSSVETTFQYRSCETCGKYQAKELT